MPNSKSMLDLRIKKTSPTTLTSHTKKKYFSFPCRPNNSLLNKEWKNLKKLSLQKIHRQTNIHNKQSKSWHVVVQKHTYIHTNKHTKYLYLSIPENRSVKVQPTILKLDTVKLLTYNTGTATKLNVNVSNECMELL